MSSLADLRAGDIGFGPISGDVGVAIDAAQILLRQGFHVGELVIDHVFMVAGMTYHATTGDAHPEVVEAMPSGARKVLIPDRWTPRYAYVRLPEDYPGQAGDAAALARQMIGTPYSFASYAALAAWRFGWKAKRLERWIDRRKVDFIDWRDMPAGASTDILANFVNQGREPMPMHLPVEAICSVLVDQAWSLTGKQIMQNTPHQCVTPGALAGRLLEMEGAKWIYPS